MTHASSIAEERNVQGIGAHGGRDLNESAQRMEEEVAQRLGGERIPDSGNLREYPGDVITDDAVISCKETQHSPPKRIQDAIRYQDRWGRKQWMLIERYSCTGSPTETVTISLQHFEMLMKATERQVWNPWTQTWTHEEEEG